MNELRPEELNEIRERAKIDRNKDPEIIEDWYTRTIWRLRLRTSAINNLLLLEEIDRLKGKTNDD
jgi:hypothetical protein